MIVFNYETREGKENRVENNGIKNIALWLKPNKNSSRRENKTSSFKGYIS